MSRVIFFMVRLKRKSKVCQPPGFEDPNFTDRVYTVENALYGLHQAPRAWYETLSTYLLENRFQKGKIDKTLFIGRGKGDILLVQVTAVKQKEDEIFISQDKYVTEILKKFSFTDVKTASTLMETQEPLLKDEDGEEVDYPKDSPFDLVAYTDSDYAGASLDRKSTTRVPLIGYEEGNDDVVLGKRERANVALEERGVKAGEAVRID
ncbi:retrovirus-related pol polyprotein from transposon TNT 1-94 [Tanacetum coccineum]